MKEYLGRSKKSIFASWWLFVLVFLSCMTSLIQTFDGDITIVVQRRGVVVKWYVVWSCSYMQPWGQIVTKWSSAFIGPDNGVCSRSLIKLSPHDEKILGIILLWLDVICATYLVLGRSHRLPTMSEDFHYTLPTSHSLFGIDWLNNLSTETSKTGVKYDIIGW